MAALILEESIDLDLKALAALTAYTGISGIFYIATDQDFKSSAWVVYKKLDDANFENNVNVVWQNRNGYLSFVCYSSNRFDARKMANVIVEHYKDFTGKLGSSDGVIVNEIIIYNDYDIGIIDKKYAVNVEMQIKYREQ